MWFAGDLTRIDALSERVGRRVLGLVYRQRH